jgi:hypothetical protein
MQETLALVEIEEMQVLQEILVQQEMQETQVIIVLEVYLVMAAPEVMRVQLARAEEVRSQQTLWEPVVLVQPVQ